MNQTQIKLITVLLTSALVSSAFAHINDDDNGQRTWSDAEAHKIIEAAEEQANKERELAKTSTTKDKAACDPVLAKSDTGEAKAQSELDTEKAIDSADSESK